MKGNISIKISDRRFILYILQLYGYFTIDLIIDIICFYIPFRDLVKFVTLAHYILMFLSLA